MHDISAAHAASDATSVRDFEVRAFTIGIAGLVESGKSALLLALCRLLRDNYSIAVVTNDVSTQAGREFLMRHKALASDRIAAVGTTGPEPSRDDRVRGNLDALASLMEMFRPDLLFVECAGDDAGFIRELADFTIGVVAASGGRATPEEEAIRLAHSDLFVINKTRPETPVDGVVARDYARIGGDRRFTVAQVRHGIGIMDVARHVLARWRQVTAPTVWAEPSKQAAALSAQV